MMGKNNIQFYSWIMNISCKRMSGEMNTSVSNGFMNLLLTHFLLEEAGNKNYDSVIEGDDSLNYYDVRPPTSEEYREMGANIKIEYPDNISEASFCGQIFDPSDMDNVVNPLEALVTFGWVKNQYMFANAKTLKSLLRCKALSLLYQYSGCPILRETALYGLRVTQDISQADVMKTIDKMKMSMYERERIEMLFETSNEEMVFTNTVKDNTRNLVSRKFGIPVELQLQYENYIRNQTTLAPIVFPEFLHHMPQTWTHFYYTYGMETPEFTIKTANSIPSCTVTTGHKSIFYLRGDRLL